MGARVLEHSLNSSYVHLPTCTLYLLLDSLACFVGLCTQFVQLSHIELIILVTFKCLLTVHKLMMLKFTSKIGPEWFKMHLLECRTYKFPVL